jgi:hypothetical protein
MTYQGINPFSGELLKRFDQNSDLQMKNALATADTAFRIEAGKITHYRVYWVISPLIKAYRNIQF